MSEVKSIFGDLQNEDAKDDETNLVETIKDFIENSEKLTSNLIYEDDRHRNKSKVVLIKKNNSKRYVSMHDA